MKTFKKIFLIILMTIRVPMMIAAVIPIILLAIATSLISLGAACKIFDIATAWFNEFVEMKKEYKDLG